MARLGADFKRVKIESIHGNVAAVRDRLGTVQNLRCDYRRGGGPFPRVGEEWIIDQTLGTWTFAALVVGDPPEITGSNDGIPALVNLLAALDEAGVIVDKTTTERIRSDVHTGHPHSH